MVKKIKEYDAKLGMKHHIIDDLFFLKMKEGRVAVKLSIVIVFDQDLKRGKNIVMGLLGVCGGRRKEFGKNIHALPHKINRLF
jgi:hypothetical protein